MPEHKLRALQYLAIDEIETAVEIVAVAGDPHGTGSVLCCPAAAHVVTDLMRLEKADQILDQFGRAVAAIPVAAAGSTLRIRNDGGKPAFRVHNRLLLSFAHTGSNQRIPVCPNQCKVDMGHLLLA